MEASKPDSSGPQTPRQRVPAQSDSAAGALPIAGNPVPKSPDIVEGRRPLHEIDPDVPKCLEGQPIAIVPDKSIKDDAWVFLPPDTGLKGRVLFTPVMSAAGRRLVARTAVHDNPGAKGAFAHPGLALRLGREKEARVWVCARRPTWWEMVRFQPGLALAVAVAVITAVAAILTAEGGFLKNLQGDTSLWFVGAVFAVSLLQAISKLYKELTEANAGAVGVRVILGAIVVILIVIVLLSGHGSGSAPGGGTGTPSPSSTSP